MSTPVTELEILETTQEQAGESDIIHAYCRICLEVAYPEGILSMCGQAGPRNDDQMVYQSVDEAPGQDLCVICLELQAQTCPTCGV